MANRDWAAGFQAAAQIDRRQPSRTEVHVHEHRAPTDQSVALLKELEEKAREKILATIPLRATDVEGVLLVQRSEIDNEWRYTLRANVGGSPVTLDARSHKGGGDGVVEVLDDLQKRLAEAIAHQIIGLAIKTAEPALRAIARD